MEAEPLRSTSRPVSLLWLLKLFTQVPHLKEPLFQRDWKVKEKAQKLKKSFSEDVLAGTSSKNILAMTFRQVVMQKLLSFELVLFPPGTERDMEDLENPREVPLDTDGSVLLLCIYYLQVSTSFTLRSSEERVISVLGEVVCTLALQSTEKQFLQHLLGKTPSIFFACFNASKESFKGMDLRRKNYWWSQPLQSKMEKIGGHEFSAWTSEFIPAYRLEIDASRGVQIRVPGPGWTGSDILDMNYEDVYTLPMKQLHSGMISIYNSLSKAKRSSSFLKVVTATVAGGIVLITISTLSQFSFPQLGKGGKRPGGPRSPSSSITEHTTIESLDTEKLGTFCILVIQKIKDAFGWPDDIATETNLGARIGEIPYYLKAPHQVNSDSEASTNSADMEKMDDDIKSSVQDIASYQVVLSTDGKIVGFQPTSRVVVNHWAVNPLTKELHGGKKLSPGENILHFLRITLM
ncbi:Elongation factor P-like protein, putative isoform 2 [Hibiscus syriacus]|uniref:Elongation factor P-like protein, putative isoform 2 n=1 Tax=Hibiscus syriacus TaxID=106335 RepID=A0A6A2Z395_HIBSY|nr:Elongation factor P-like protein, putative isoform 2 [Hibiscus syriacus]